PGDEQSLLDIFHDLAELASRAQELCRSLSIDAIPTFLPDAIGSIRSSAFLLSSVPQDFLADKVTDILSSEASEHISTAENYCAQLIAERYRVAEYISLDECRNAQPDELSSLDSDLCDLTNQ